MKKDIAKPSKAQVRKVIGEYALLTLATAIMTVGIYFFKFPNNFNFGGVTGIAVLLAKVLPFSTGTINLVINMLLLIVGLIFLGRDFAFKTVYVSVLNSAALSLLEIWLPLDEPLTGQPFLELCFAVFLPALGSALMFNIGASSGGTDIFAMILKKYTSFNIGTALLYSDVVIVIFAFFVFDMQTALFSVLGFLVKSLVIDNVIESINLSKYFNVVCDNPTPICAFITENLSRSATVCKAQGAFSGHDKFIIFAAMKPSQAVKLRSYIKRIEPTAFILISNTSEIIGNGFRS